MLRVLCDMICVLLMILGFVEVIKFLILKLTTVRENRDELLVLPIYGHDEKAEMILRSAAAKVEWNNLNDNKLIVCLDCGMDAETKHICDTISSEYTFIRVYNLKEFEKMFK